MTSEEAYASINDELRTVTAPVAAVYSVKTIMLNSGRERVNYACPEAWDETKALKFLLGAE